MENEKVCSECDGVGYFYDTSECCGASMEYGICLDCKEHCGELECESCNY